MWLAARGEVGLANRLERRQGVALGHGHIVLVGVHVHPGGRDEGRGEGTEGGGAKAV